MMIVDIIKEKRTIFNFEILYIQLKRLFRKILFNIKSSISSKSQKSFHFSLFSLAAISPNPHFPTIILSNNLA